MTMKIDINHYENYEYNGKRWFHIEKVSDNLDMYVGESGCGIVFEKDTLEEVGAIYESENRTNFKRYYNADFHMGWDGKKKTKKEFFKTLCTRSTYQTAIGLIIQEYKAKTA
jgi:hypothetical protein